jgi:zinc/manganese transport system substrate-binding protein/manganese/iron transport system substrate-binding protein
VVVSNSILADFVSVLSAGRVDITVLVPQNTDPRKYVLTSSDVTALSNADLVVENGLGLEPWLDTFLQSADLRGSVKSATLGTSTRIDETGTVDPFVWVSPSNARIMVSNIRVALAALLPDSASAFQSAERAYDATLDSTISYVRRVMDPVKQRRLVYVGVPLGYFCDEFALSCTGVSTAGVTSATPATTAEIAKLLTAVKDAKAAAIVVADDVPPAIVDNIKANAVNTTRARVTSGADGLTVTSVGDGNSRHPDYLSLQRDIADLLSTNLR